MKHSVIIPYRDRHEHLHEFIPAITQYLPDASIVIVEQADNKPFNRAKLLNIGVLQAPANYYTFHDVDKIPLRVDYSFPNSPTQLAKSDIQPIGYFGGVTMFNHDDFYRINGFTNQYFCRAEDNEMWFHCRRNKLRIVYRIGEFKELPHERKGPEFEPHLWAKAQIPRMPNDGLSNTKFELISEVKPLANVIHLLVEL